jgi:hypothetical protein
VEHGIESSIPPLEVQLKGIGSALDQTTCANHLSRVANLGRTARPTAQMTQVSLAITLNPQESMGAKKQKTSHATEWEHGGAWTCADNARSS